MPDHRGWHARGYLPHLDAADVVQAVTFRLADSLPADVLLRLKDTAENDAGRLRRAVARQLDAGHGGCLLSRPEAAAAVQDALLRFHPEHYALIAWVVMPNHVHVVIETKQGHSLSNIVKSWKGYSARRINVLHGASGRLWQPDYYDRRIRDDAHLAAAVAYVEDNPVKAGLVARPEDWAFSSAAGRADLEVRAPWRAWTPCPARAT